MHDLISGEMMTEISEILKKLQQNPIENAWAIQDLSLWPERSKIYGLDNAKGFSYLLVTGHPSQERHPMVVLNDSGGEIETLFQHLPVKPFVIRETRKSVLEKVQPLFPSARIFLEQRMDLQKAKAKTLAAPAARILTEDDAEKLAQFMKIPVQAAGGLKFWIRGAVIMAVFKDEKIVSMGTTIVRTNEVWDLAGIRTLPEYQRQGLATDVVSALAIEAFKHVDTVTLTVLKDNVAALRTYSKLGFQQMEDRVWIDNGTGSTP